MGPERFLPSLLSPGKGWHPPSPQDEAAVTGVMQEPPPAPGAWQCWWHSLAWTCRQHLAQAISGLVPSSPTQELAGSGSVFSPLEVKHISGMRGRVFWPHLEGGGAEGPSVTEARAASFSVCRDCRAEGDLQRGRRPRTVGPGPHSPLPGLSKESRYQAATSPCSSSPARVTPLDTVTASPAVCGGLPAV